MITSNINSIYTIVCIIAICFGTGIAVVLTGGLLYIFFGFLWNMTEKLAQKIKRWRN